MLIFYDDLHLLNLCLTLLLTGFEAIYTYVYPIQILNFIVLCMFGITQATGCSKIFSLFIFRREFLFLRAGVFVLNNGRRFEKLTRP